MAWEEEDKQRILALAEEGLSASQIARRMGIWVSRNAVIGVVYRANKHLGKPRRVPLIKSNRRPRKPRQVVVPAAAPLTVDDILPAIFSEDGDPVTLSHAAHGMCRAIWGDVTRDSYICGRDTHDGAFCPEHRKKFWQPSKNKAAS